MRLRPKVVTVVNSPNKSARTSSIKLIVLHSTESHDIPGDADIKGVAGWLSNPVANASCHVIVDGDGHSGRVVPDNMKAWHCVDYNSVSLGIEQIGFASYGKLNWIKRSRELTEAARWIACWSIRYDIPIRHANVKDDGTFRSGVTMHKNLGIKGGGHVDPGKYPFDKVLKKAAQIKRRLQAQD